MRQRPASTQQTGTTFRSVNSYILVEASIDGRPVTLLVDTGANKTILNARSIAVAVKSSDSGDSSRDLHMLQVTRGGQFPMVTVRTQLAENASTSGTIHADLEVQFAGQPAKYDQVPFQQTTQGNEIRISGIIPDTLSEFKVDPPSLLTMPVKNEIPVRVEMSWRGRNDMAMGHLISAVFCRPSLM